MTRDEARQEILVRVSALDYLQKSERGNYICPFCKSGTGANKTGAMKYYRETNTVACFGRCALDNGTVGRKYDVIDLHRQYTGTDYNTAVSDLARQIGITIDPYIPERDYTRPQKIKPAGSPTTDFSGQGKANTLPTENASTEAQKAPQEVQYMQEVQKDYTEYFRECKARLSDPAAADYLALRGISPELARRFWIGFDPKWRSPAAIERGKNPPYSPRLIIPTSTSSYIARDIRPDVDYAKMKEGEVHLFHTKDLYNEAERPVFITEGEIDALSIIEAGGLATALGSTTNWKSLVDLLRDKRTNNTLILCLDNDDSGRAATRELAAALQGLNISFIRADIAVGYNDPNEALTADREAFTKAIRAAERQTAAKPDSMADYFSRCFDDEIAQFQKASIRKTGFPNLDKEAGGIYPGLYVLGAISSLGKTTLIHQIADQMAGAGEHVLFFSLEQSRFEMASKSLARMAFYKSNGSVSISSLEIRKGKDVPAVQEAQKEYVKAIAPRMSIIEGNFNCNISFIGDYVARYIKNNGRKPVVIVDYLQILDGMDDQKQNTRDIVDTNVRELKRMSRNHDIPVIVISSLNRNNYLTPVDFESFKESGGIEYTADVIWGLQLSVMTDDLFNATNKTKEKRDKVREAKAGNPRKIQLVCLKNRYGVSSYTADFLYYPANDYYRPAGQEYVNWKPTYENAEQIAKELEADLEAMYRAMVL